jgi:hypothetical protein
MPPLGLHMTIARDLANDLRAPVVDAERGAYYLGATTPDIRVLTRWDREQTHFFRLDDFHEQSGVHRLFEQEPALRDASTLDPQTAAFLAGYISHLVMDEDYICRIYRPLFGERSDLRDDPLANVMDKALQFDLDRSDREDGTRCTEIRQALKEAAVEVNVNFIARETLLSWRDISVDVISAAPAWERFSRIASRYLAAAGIDGEEGLARFMEGVPALLRRTWQHVGEERVREYLRDGKSRARDAIKEYLS